MNRKTNLLYIPFYFIVLSLISCVKSSSHKATNTVSLDVHVNNLIKPLIDSSKIAGTTIGVAKGGNILFVKSYGFNDVESKAELPANATFEIASVTKPFTAIAILQLAEKGLLDLEDDISKYIQFDSKGKIVTVKQLLDHTSGIKDYTRSVIPNKLDGITYAKDTIVRMLEKEAFEFEPGEAMSYSNSGYFMLGLIIEKVSGLSYNDYLRQYIYNPANLENTCDCGNLLSGPNNLAQGYNINKDGNLIKVNPGDFKLASAAGSLCSTAEDLLTWSIALHNAEKLLSKDSYRAMITPSKLANGTTLRYGLGLEINTYKGNEVISHHGIIEGFLSDIKYFPAYDLTVVTLINTLGPVKPKDVTTAIADYYIDEKRNEQKFEGDLSPLVGTYTGKVMGRALTRNFEADGTQLYISIGEEKQPLNYIGNDNWSGEDDYIYSFTQQKTTKVQISAPLMSVSFTKIE
ncbi:serine hydrolase domain-containing protein [Pontibacter sp. H249]|uniref:serine hydrolase domain-containing protein n=1 Tax=Pontibacter sp. H249 TaxID=3133420 RepID=UPI0030C2F95F